MIQNLGTPNHLPHHPSASTPHGPPPHRRHGRPTREPLRAAPVPGRCARPPFPLPCHPVANPPVPSQTHRRLFAPIHLISAFTHGAAIMVNPLNYSHMLSPRGKSLRPNFFPGPSFFLCWIGGYFYSAISPLHFFLVSGSVCECPFTTIEHFAPVHHGLPNGPPPPSQRRGPWRSGCPSWRSRGTPPSCGPTRWTSRPSPPRPLPLPSPSPSLIPVSWSGPLKQLSRIANDSGSREFLLRECAERESTAGPCPRAERGGPPGHGAPHRPPPTGDPPAPPPGASPSTEPSPRSGPSPCLIPWNGVDLF